MAGIGFSLRKLFKDKSFFGYAKAYSWTGMVTTGPFVGTAALILGVQFLYTSFGISDFLRYLFIESLIYAFIFSHIVVSGFNMVITRYIADKMYEHDLKSILSSMFGVFSLVLAVGGIGGACILLASEEWAKANGHEVLAYLTFQETAAVDFVEKKEGLLMAPAYAVPRMLDRAGIKLQDFDYYEIHEAFASQVLSTLKAWEDPKFCKERLGLDAPLGSIDRTKLNVNGSSLAAGHPFAATGGRILATAAKLINQKGSGRVLISICAAGGQGVTAIVEK